MESRDERKRVCYGHDQDLPGREGANAGDDIRKWCLHSVWRWVCLRGRHGRLRRLRKRQEIQRRVGEFVLDVRGW